MRGGSEIEEVQEMGSLILGRLRKTSKIDKMLSDLSCLFCGATRGRVI